MAASATYAPPASGTNGSRPQSESTESSKRKRADPELIIKRYERYKNRKQTADNTVQEMLDYLCPRKANITTKTSEGTRNTQKQYDSTGEDAGKKLAGTMHGTLTSASQKWFSLMPRDEELRNDKEVTDWCEECADRLYSGFNQSNFAQEISEVYLDLAYIGTGSLLMEEKGPSTPGTFSGFRFTALAFGDYCYDENADGYVDTQYRIFRLSRQALVDKWKDAVPEDVRRAVEKAPEEEVEVLHAVYPRTERDPRKSDKTNMPWASCYVLMKPATLLSESGFHEFPGAVVRWAKQSGEIYGRGPGHTAYPDVRTLNRTVEIKLEAAGKAIDPPLLMLHESVFGDVSLDPASINIVSEKGAIEALDTKSRFDVSKMTTDELKLQIRQAFYNDLLVTIDKPNMTATEFAGRQEELQRMLGPTMGRMHAELLRAIVERGFGLMFRAGALPPIPMVLQQQAADIDVVYEGPLARAQRASDLLAIQRKNAWLREQLEMGNTSAADNFEPDEEAQEIAAIVGLPSNIVRSAKKRDEIRMRKASQDRQNANLQKLATMAEAGGKVAPLMTAAADPGVQQMMGSSQTAGAA